MARIHLPRGSVKISFTSLREANAMLRKSMQAKADLELLADSPENAKELCRLRSQIYWCRYSIKNHF